MHAISFALKRAHLRAVDAGKKAVREVGDMTPARFDLLYYLRRVALFDAVENHPLRAGESQAQIAKDLGLHRSTVSVMLKRLLELGWVQRVRRPTDRRTWDITLTEVGLRKIFKAMKLVFRQRRLLSQYETLFHAPEGNTDPAQHVVAKVGRVCDILRAIAYFFGGRVRVWFDYGDRWENGFLRWKFV